MRKFSKKNLIVVTAGAALAILSSSALATYDMGVSFDARNVTNTSTGQAPAGPLTVTVTSATVTSSAPNSHLTQQGENNFKTTITAQPNTPSNAATESLIAGQMPGSSTYSLAINFTMSINGGAPVNNTQTINITGTDTATLSNTPIVSPAGNICNFYLNNIHMYGQVSFFVACQPA